MNHYKLNIKNPGVGSDYEDETIAETKEEAVKEFLETIQSYGGYDWDEELVEKNVYEELDKSS